MRGTVLLRYSSGACAGSGMVRLLAAATAGRRYVDPCVSGVLSGTVRRRRRRRCRGYGRNGNPCVCGVCSFRFNFPHVLFVFFFPPSLLIIFQPPLFIVFDLHQNTNNRDRPSCPTVWFASLSCRTVSFSLSFYSVLLVPIRPPTPNDDTPTPSLLWSWNWYLIRFECTSLQTDLLITRIRHYFIDRYYCNVSTSTWYCYYQS